MGLKDTIKGWFGSARKEAEELAERAEPYVDKAVEKTRETTSELIEKAEPYVDKALERTMEKAGEARERIAEREKRRQAASSEEE